MGPDGQFPSRWRICFCCYCLVVSRKWRENVQKEKLNALSRRASLHPGTGIEMDAVYTAHGTSAVGATVRQQQNKRRGFCTDSHCWLLRDKFWTKISSNQRLKDSVFFLCFVFKSESKRDQSKSMGYQKELWGKKHIFKRAMDAGLRCLHPTSLEPSFGWTMERYPVSWKSLFFLDDCVSLSPSFFFRLILLTVSWKSITARLPSTDAKEKQLV